MTEKPQEQPEEGSSSKPPLADQIKAKMDEYELDRHLNDLATTLEHAVRTGMTKAGEFAHEHKGDFERLIDKAATAVDRRTDGKHADKIQQVRGSLERGVDKIAEQRDDGTPGEQGGSDVPPSNG
jgi:RNA-splicing ligase RtcB